MTPEGASGVGWKRKKHLPAERPFPDLGVLHFSDFIRRVVERSGQVAIWRHFCVLPDSAAPRISLQTWHYIFLLPGLK